MTGCGVGGVSSVNCLLCDYLSLLVVAAAMALVLSLVLFSCRNLVGKIFTREE